MKRIIACMLVLMLLPFALADSMVVVNCEEWVSLRKSPDTSAERLKKVPLYEVVTDCEWADNGFVRCTYDGETGYILEKYLDTYEPDEPDSFLDVKVGDMSVLAYRAYSDDRQNLTVSVFDEDGESLWGMRTDSYATELDTVDAFIGGTADAPRLMVYTSESGLDCYELRTGETVWTLPEAEVHLGASLQHAVEADGTMYICGYYGPDPVCIDVNGQVRWQSDVGSDDIYWPYEIDLTDEGVATHYDVMNEGSGWVIFDKADGHVLRMEQE